MHQISRPEEDFFGDARHGGRGEGGAVGAVGDLVVFPGEVVEAFGDVAREGLGRENGGDGVDFLDGEGRGFFAGGEVVGR